jgi:glycosyltransferase involved in cell wall biosynthesis
MCAQDTAQALASAIMGAIHGYFCHPRGTSTMHIAINGWFCSQPNTGSGQYLMQLLAGLRQLKLADLEITVIMPSVQANYEMPGGVNVIVTNIGPSKMGKVWFEQRTFPHAAKQINADLLHVPYWAPPLSAHAPLVVSVLDVIPLLLPQYAQGFGAQLYLSLVVAATQGANHLLTISEAAKADILKHLSVPSERVTATHLAAAAVFHPRMGAEGDAAVRQKYNLPERFVLYLGGFDVRKQVPALLQAYTYLRKTDADAPPLVLAGNPPAFGTSVFPDIPAEIKRLGLQEYVQWIGYVEEVHKPALYRLAEVFVYPSVYEGFGLPVLESMASGTPVIASEIPPMVELVGDGAFLVPPAPLDGNADKFQLATRKMGGALIALLGQPSLYDSMVNQGLAQATRYTWRKTAQATVDVYRQVLATVKRG